MERKDCRSIQQVEVALLYKSSLIRLPKNLVAKNRDYFLRTGPPKGCFSKIPSHSFNIWDSQIKQDIIPTTPYNHDTTDSI